MSSEPVEAKSYEEMERAILDLVREMERNIPRVIASGQLTLDHIVVHPDTERAIREAMYRDWLKGYL